MFFRSIKKILASEKFLLVDIGARVAIGGYVVGSLSYNLFINIQKRKNTPSIVIPSPVLPSRSPVLSLGIDPSIIKITNYSQIAYCKEHNLNGICFGASLVEVTKPNSLDEDLAAFLHKVYMINPSSHAKEISIAAYFDIDRAEIKSVAVESEGTSLAKLDKFYSDTSALVSQKENMQSRAVFVGIDTHTDRGFFEGYHAFRFNFFPNNRCSTYDANVGKIEGPCPEIQEIFRHTLKSYYATKAQLQYVSLDRPKNSSNEEVADASSSENKPKL